MWQSDEELVGLDVYLGGKSGSERGNVRKSWVFSYTMCDEGNRIDPHSIDPDFPRQLVRGQSIPGQCALLQDDVMRAALN